jgi:acid phosphatase (class A)
LLVVALAAGACSTTPAPPPTSAAVVGEVRTGSGYLNGYLTPTQLPDSLALLPPPPAPGSTAQTADNDSFHRLGALRGTPRGELARQDAQLKFPAAAQAFACALGVPVSAQDTPHLDMLLRRTLTDAGRATYKAKDHYQRTRPFVAFAQPSCTPQEEPYLAKDGAYPSGHAAVGWAWALVLAQVAPDRTDALLQRGRAFGQSRGICGVHWRSDIEAGRLVGAATVARLQSDAVFNAQLALARTEMAQARQRGATPGPQCTAHHEALAASAALAP